MMFDSVSRAKIVRSNFFDNKAFLSNGGGGAMVVYLGKIDLDGVVFGNNVANQGRDIYIEDDVASVVATFVDCEPGVIFCNGLEGIQESGEIVLNSNCASRNGVTGKPGTAPCPRL